MAFETKFENVRPIESKLETKRETDDSGNVRIIDVTITKIGEHTSSVLVPTGYANHIDQVVKSKVNFGSERYATQFAITPFDEVLDVTVKSSATGGGAGTYNFGTGIFSFTDESAAGADAEAHIQLRKNATKDTTITWTLAQD